MISRLKKIEWFSLDVRAFDMGFTLSLLPLHSPIPALMDSYSDTNCSGHHSWYRKWQVEKLNSKRKYKNNRMMKIANNLK